MNCCEAKDGLERAVRRGHENGKMYSDGNRLTAAPSKAGPAIPLSGTLELAAAGLAQSPRGPRSR
jgi:hypothetical protein